MNRPRILLWAALLAAVTVFTSHAQEVIISEVVSDNTKIDDEDANSPAWIELHNTGDSDAVLDGYYLTDSEETPNLWQIESLTIPRNEVRLIFASGKDRSPSAATVDESNIHTSFNLNDNGGYLALVNPDGQTIVSTITYPELSKNVSYGMRDSDVGYFFPATPNEPNSKSPSPNGLTPSVKFSHQGGVVEGSTEVTLEVPDHPEASIRYSLDGTEPSLFTPLYSGPITVDKTMLLTVRAQLPDHLPSRVDGKAFIVMDESLTQFAETGKVFESNLPIILIDSFGATVDNSRAFKDAVTVVITPDVETGRATLTDEPEYNGNSGVHTRGESSFGFGQKSYALELRDIDGEDRNESLLGMPAESDWALYGPWSEKSLMRNKLIYDWMRELRGDDGTSVRSEFCEVLFNQRDTDTLGYDSYRGIFLLVEKIKVDRNRVPIQQMNEQTVDPQMITGGYIFRKDKDDSGRTRISYGSRYGMGSLQSFSPDHLNDEQLDYIRGYLTDLEQSLAPDVRDDPKRGYRAFLEPDTFIDAQLMIEGTKQIDGYVFSSYWHKDRNGKVRAGPL